MSASLQTHDFFILEAGEALDALEQALAAAPAPPADTLVRAARLLRGAALMARQQPIARAAAAFETVTRHYREQPSSWNERLRETLERAVPELRTLAGRVRDWSEVDTAHALRLGRDLERLTGNGHGLDTLLVGDGDNADADNPSAQTSGTVETGVRAFVARESALVASALDRTARALRAGTADREPLYTVIRRMQSLRGLAELSELAPLPEMLDGIELAISDLIRTFAPPPDAHTVIEAAAAALTRLAREVAASGRPDPDAVEIRRFTDRLIRVFAIDNDIVSITALLDDSEAASEAASVQPAAVGFRSPEPLTSVALVSYGEHLSRTAEVLEHAHSPTARDLRLYQLLGTLRGIEAAGPESDPAAVALGVFARAVRSVLAINAADDAMPRLLSGLSEAGTLLRQMADSGDSRSISESVLMVARRLDGNVVEPPAVPIEQLLADAATDDGSIVPIEQLLVNAGNGDESPIVPIEQLLAAPESSVVPIELLLLTEDELPIEDSSIVPIEQLLVAAEGDDSPIVPIEQLLLAENHSALEASFRTYRRLASEQREEFPSLATFFRSSPAHQANADLATEQPVAIETLCYRGPAALERATEIQSHLRAALAAGNTVLPTIQPLLDELLDLIPLAAAS